MQDISFRLFSSWWTYEKEALGDQQLFFNRRRDILFSRILILSICITLFLSIKDFILVKVGISVLIDLLILLVIVSAFWMTQSGHQKIAKSFFLILMNAFIAFYATTLPIDRGVFLYFFPLIALSFAVIDDDERILRVIFIIVPIMLLILLVVTDFNLLGNIKISTSQNGKINMVINALVTTFMVVFFVEFILRANRQSEKLLLQMKDYLERKNNDIEKINRELDRFVYSTSHDLRAPLLSIQGLTKVALMDPDTSRNKDYFSMISERAHKLDEFIKEIIDYSRNSRTELVYEPTDLGKIIHDVIANLQFIENAERIKFETVDHAGIVILDRSRIKMVMNNLISNAIKYQNLRAETSVATITTSVEDNLCKIEVKDNGIGISSDLQPKIFEMFYRATEQSLGSGLGLYIVKEIVEKMNGTITVQSELSLGTTFSISVPTGTSAD